MRSLKRLGTILTKSLTINAHLVFEILGSKEILDSIPTTKKNPNISTCSRLGQFYLVVQNIYRKVKSIKTGLYGNQLIPKKSQ